MKDTMLLTSPYLPSRDGTKRSGAPSSALAGERRPTTRNVPTSRKGRADKRLSLICAIGRTGTEGRGAT